MASAKFGNIIVDMRGKINGNVYSKNKGGAYVRTRVKPSNPRTAAQTDVRSVLTSLSQAWRGLTAVQIAGWNQAAINFQRSNRVGDRHVLNGNALFVSFGKNLADVGLPYVPDAPTPEAVLSNTVASAVADNSSQSLVITLDGTVAAGTSIKVFASPTVSAGVNSIGTKMRQIAFFNTGHAAILTLTTAYLAKFGAIGEVGSKIFYKIVTVNENNGQLGETVSGQIIIQA